MTTTEIARRHGYTGPMTCQDCGTPENLHFATWFDPAAGESGDFLECCACGIAAGDPAEVHDDCEPDEEPCGGGEAGPEVRVFRRADGWAMQPPDPEPCTTNFHRRQDGRSPCTATAVWKVVEDHGLHLTIGFYCDTDLPAERRPEHGGAA
ncbi:putative protein OS=Streptomyces rimosus subsp. rimosus (strain ATCC / DSM 40260 / JCM 4667 / NRRL 2234) OX=1265868 GN=SRIM_017515 PE=4 SV=1 [Streptomyces rimosus subsp. rimosus]